MKKFPWRLFFALLVLGCAALFAGLNLERVNVSVGVHVFRDVPLFLALVVAFIAGAVCVLPYAFVPRRGKARRIRHDAAQQPGAGAPSS